MSSAVAILTRALEDGAALASHLRAEGVRVIEMPCLRIEPLADDRALSGELDRLGPEDWLVVTSRAGADAVSRAGSTRARVAAIGETTAARLRDRGIAVDFEPDVATGARLAETLPTGRVALLARSDRALADLPRILRARGFEVREAIAYRTIAEAGGDIGGARDALADRTRDVRVFVASPSAVVAFVGAIDADLAARATFVPSGPSTAAAVRAFVPGARIASEQEVSAVVARR